MKRAYDDVENFTDKKWSYTGQIATAAEAKKKIKIKIKINKP